MAPSSSAGFLTLPGGIGTFEEFFEILTWAALGLHPKPIGILNVEGYFDPLLALIDTGSQRRLHPPQSPGPRSFPIARKPRRRPPRNVPRPPGAMIKPEQS